MSIKAAYTLLAAVWLLLIYANQGSAKTWPIVYPATSERNVLVLSKDTGRLVDGQGSFGWFYCRDLAINSTPPLSRQECDPSVEIQSPNPVFKLALSAVDQDGIFTTLQMLLPISVNVDEAEAVVQNIWTLNSVNTDIHTTWATLEIEIKVLISEHPVEVNVSFGNDTRRVVLWHDNRQPTWLWKLRGKSGQNFESEIHFSEPIFLSTGTYCDRRLCELIPTTIKENRIEYCNKEDAYNPPHAVSAVLDKSEPCIEDKGGERNITIEQLLKKHSNAVLESLEASFVANRTVLLLNGRLKPRINETMESSKAEIQLIVREYSFRDAAGNQLATNITVEGNVTENWLWSYETGEEVGRLASRAALATSAAAMVAYLSPSFYGGELGASGSPGSATELLTMGQKFYYIGRVGRGEMPENYQAVSSQYNSYAFDMDLPWAKKHNTTRVKTQSINNKIGEPEALDDSVTVLKVPVDILEGAESLEFENEDDPYKALLKVTFWVCMLYGMLCIMRCLLVGVLWILKRDTPSPLIFPRLEILATFWAAPAIAAKCPDLLGTNAGGFILAVIVFLFFPGLFLCIQIAILHTFFFRHDPKNWRVRLISIKHAPSLAKTNTQNSDFILNINKSESAEIIDCAPQTSVVTRPQDKSESAQQEVAETGIPDEENILNKSEHEIQTLQTTKGKETQDNEAFQLQGCASASSVTWLKRQTSYEAMEPVPAEILHEEQDKSTMTLFDHMVRPFVGPPIDKTKWESVNNEDRFLHRFGPLFEDFRAPSFSERNTNYADRASLARLLTLATALADSAKLITVAMICNADLHEMASGQLICALLLTFAFFVFLRVLRPFRSRARLALILFIEFLDCLTFALAIVAVTVGRDDPDLKQKCGLSMLCTQGLVYLLMFLEKALSSCVTAFAACITFLKPCISKTSD